MIRTTGIVWLIILCLACSREKIDRETVVSRHDININEVDTLNSLTLGNGRFAMTMDITGLQTFPVEYHNGVPLGTMSEWGWHSFPAQREFSIDETLQSLESHGRNIPYACQWPAREAADYLRQNPHRIHLASVGLSIKKSDGITIAVSDIKNIDQKLDLWNGEIVSRFEVDGVPVEVISLIGQDDNDILGVKISSRLISEGRLGLTIKYPCPTGQFLDEASNFIYTKNNGLQIQNSHPKSLSIYRALDTTSYFTNVSFSSAIAAVSPVTGGFYIKPDSMKSSLTAFVSFSRSESFFPENDFDAFSEKVHSAFNSFWEEGGIIDFGKVKDPRANELERRMILSLYLTKVNCGGSSFAQETGLTYNSWYGRPHMEMAWWHGVHFALWGHPEILEKQMGWYLRNEGAALEIARRQGFRGVRWQKMTDNEGRETPSSVGSYLIWQQPHVIYFAELLYRISNDEKTLNKYRDVVDQTAEFMASFAYYDPVLKRYTLPGVIPAQEQFDPETTFNPTFELAYWRWALETAQQWRQREGLCRNPDWDKVLRGLSPLPQKDGLYLAAESAPDSYTNPQYLEDHPAVLGAYGMLPATEGLDTAVMHHTLAFIKENWHWQKTWGWDFPMAAMTAARLGYPDEAVDFLLMPVMTNTYLKNGHNFQNKRLRIYLPGNGGFLTALAMMASGTGERPGSCFPTGWDVRYEGLNRMP
jgi:protein-glucosylgalactosylhydroxylysine glucosidase